MPRLTLLLVTLTAVLAATSSASAAVCDYTGASPGSWDVAGNWSCNHVPATVDNAFVSNGDSVSVDAADAVQGLDVSGGTLTVAPSGSLTATTTGFSGGTLRVDGAFVGNLTIGSNAILTGPGTIAGAVVNAGTIRPGLAAGKLTITGTYAQNPTGRLEIDIFGATPGSQLDQLVVVDKATLGGTVKVLGTFDPTMLSDAYPFLTSGSRAGSFASLLNAGLPGGKVYTLDYPDGPAFGARLIVAIPPPPTPTGAVSISGRLVPGEAATCNPGSWTGSPTFALLWYRDNDPIPGETSATYTIKAQDLGHFIGCHVAATNAGGSGEAIGGSNVPEILPANVALPSIFGTPDLGSTVGCDTGFWSGVPEPKLVAQWFRNGEEIIGAVSFKYKLLIADAGTALTCQVKATNPGGSVIATSADFKTAALPRDVAISLMANGDIAKALGLPSSKSCIVRSPFKVKLRKLTGVTVASTSMRRDGKPVILVKRSGRLTATFNLKRTPKVAFALTVTVKASSGIQLVGRAHYRACIGKKANDGSGDVAA